MDAHEQLRKKLLDLKTTLPAIILADHFALRPDMARAYTDHQKTHFQNDVAWILSFLAEAVWARQPALFEEFVAWLKTFLTSVKVPMKDLKESFRLIKNRINDVCSPEENQIINAMLDRAMEMVMEEEIRLSLPAMETNLDPLARNYLDNLLVGRRNIALDMVMQEVTGGTQVKEIYLRVFQPVQYEIGRLWQTNRISVAQEHYCTGATQLVMSQLYPYLFTGKKKQKKMVTTCVPGELHELGARMVTDFFEMEGWDTYYLGANMPVDGVIRFVREVQPSFLAISATMTYHVSLVDEMIHSIRSSVGIPGDLKIMVGGYPFKVVERLWERVGANGYAMDAQEAIRVADTLIAA